MKTSSSSLVGITFFDHCKPFQYDLTVCGDTANGIEAMHSGSQRRPRPVTVVEGVRPLASTT